MFSKVTGELEEVIAMAMELDKLNQAGQRRYVPRAALPLPHQAPWARLRLYAELDLRTDSGPQRALAAYIRMAMPSVKVILNAADPTVCARLDGYTDSTRRSRRSGAQNSFS